MNTHERLQTLIVKYEGLKLKPYLDTEKKLTIGVGRNLDDMGITTEEAYFLLNNDIDRCYLDVQTRFPWFNNLSSTRQDVIISMVFNMGITRFLKFKKMISALERNLFSVAAQEMIGSKWAEQVGIRAKDLSEMMKTDNYV